MPGSPALDRVPGWQARLTLGFTASGSRTLLSHRASLGPLRVQRPFYSDDGYCHVYLLHPPGGIVGGDILEISVDAGPQSRVLLTTPAAGKFYRSSGAMARQSQRLRVRQGAVLEWLPQETIVFNGAFARNATRIDLDAEARVIAWEILCLGRPASGERFRSGDYGQSMELYRQGRPVLIERGRYEGGGAVHEAQWGLGGRPVSALLVASDCAEVDLGAVRAQLADGQRGAVAVTRVDDILVVRWLGEQAEHARESLGRVWQWLRLQVQPDVRPLRPRIWET